MAEEVDELEERLSELVHEMRAVCVLAARSPRDADAMASVLQVVSAIERMGNAAVDIARIVTRRLGIPRALVADLSAAEEISHRVRVRDELADGPPRPGRPRAARRGGHAGRRHPPGPRVDHRRRRRRGAAAGRRAVPPGRPRRASPSCARWPARPTGSRPQPPEDPALTDLDRAIDVLVEMKNISEVAVGLAYSALVLRDQGLAAEVNHLEDRLDEMKERLELWVLRAAPEQIDPSRLRGLHAPGPGGRGDRRRRPADGVADRGGRGAAPDPGPGPGRRRRGRRAGAGRPRARPPTAPRSPSCGWRPRPASTCSPSAGAGATSTGPARAVVLAAGDELIATGPDEGHALLAELCGYRLIEDDDTGTHELIQVSAVGTGRRQQPVLAAGSTSSRRW